MPKDNGLLEPYRVVIYTHFHHQFIKCLNNYMATFSVSGISVEMLGISDLL